MPVTLFNSNLIDRKDVAVQMPTCFLFFFAFDSSLLIFTSSTIAGSGRA